MSCEGCLATQKEQQKQRQETEKLAKRQAIKEQQPQVLYYMADGTIGFMGFEAARNNSIQAVGFISQFEQIADG